MKRVKVTLSESTVELLESVSKERNVSKSAYIGMLINGEINQTQEKVSREVLEIISNIDMDLRALICRDELTGIEKMKILEYAKDIKALLSKECRKHGIY